MTRQPSVRRPARGRSRGQALVLVAVSGVAMMSMVGLALDGGYEVVKYRDAQNAADAGALAAGRQIFVASQSGTVPTSAQLTTTSDTEVRHNNAIPGNSVLGAALNTGTVDNFVPDSGLGDRAYGGLASITANVSALGLAGVTATVGVDESQAQGLVRTTASGGSTTSGQADLVSVSAAVTSILGSLLNVQGNLLCLASTQTYPTTGIWSGSTACPNNSLSLVSAALGALGSITGSAGINLSPQSTNSYIAPSVPYLPHTIASNALASVNVLNLGTGLTANVGNVVSQVGPSASVLVSQDFNLATVATNLLGLGVSLPLLTMHEEIDYTPSGLLSAPTPTCDPGSLTLGGTTYPILSSCQISGLPPSLLGGLITVSGIPAPPTCSGLLTCTETGCFLHLGVAALSLLGVGICIAPYTLTAVGHDMSTSTAAGDTALVNAIKVTAHVDTPTFFLPILGWRKTQPTATTSAAVLQVADESGTAFANAPYAMPDVATNMNCPCSTAPLTVGDDYYLYGSSMQSDSPVDAFASTWDGQVSAPSGHQVGAILSSVSGVGSGPGTYVTGGDYYLLPVVNPANAVVEYYAVFKKVSGHSSWGQLVNTIAVQANPSTTWSPDAGGSAAAVTVKITG